ncbi:hypothetical protein LZT04_03115, partial [Vibrio fluvialis]|nr:hypothetical protein [Vibrio fluvialis]
WMYDNLILPSKRCENVEPSRPHSDLNPRKERQDGAFLIALPHFFLSSFFRLFFYLCRSPSSNTRNEASSPFSFGCLYRGLPAIQVVEQYSCHRKAPPRSQNIALSEQKTHNQIQ